MRQIKNRLTILLAFASMLLLVQACTLFGGKKNDTVDDVFKQGSIDPNLVPNNVSYVPLYPFIANVRNPLDVFVGYDDLIYVVVDNDENNIDDNELLIFDQKISLVFRLNIPGATDFTQDRRLHSYVAGRYYADEAKTTNLAAIFHIKGLESGLPVFLDTLKHFGCDESRNNTSFRGADDVAVKFTGLATLWDNTLYVARSGPRNDQTGIARPDNGVLVFNAEGVNIGFTTNLNPNQSSIKSSVGISGLATYAGPPQRLSGISTSRNFFITLSDQNTNLEYRTLSIVSTEDPDQGTIFGENTAFLNFDVTKADRFMYESYRFKKPEDIYVAPDASGYIFVTDSESDSLYIFSNAGFEGVNPPANSKVKKQIVVSFGGNGADGSSSGPFNLVDPSGVCYYNRTVFVCDKGNNRICRYKLNTDLQ
ncbi:MAG: hypothetical protein K9I36_12150 [Bacteroidia bacterium]|nr:hypothetical protein [Bacteroidia bacterium]MCF8427478.1 hypothetical protein [Bacteroidia bacterium]